MTADSTLAPWLHAAHATLVALRARGAHAALLHGPAGIGKWELAMAFSRDVLCETPDAHGRACGACPSCRLEAAGNHPDLRVVVPDALAFRRPAPAEPQDEEATTRERGDGGDGSGAEVERGATAKASREIKIEAVRNLAAFTGVSTHRGGLRVVVLGPAEALNAAAANALLKGLEEPPPQSLFLLVSDHFDWCLPTIVSRCALVRVAVPPRQAALNWLLAQGIPDAGQRLTEAGGAPLAAARDGDGLDADAAETLRGLLRLGPALRAAQIAAQIPRTIPVAASIALFQRWTWDFLSVRLGGHLRYHPEEAASFAALAQAWRPDAAVSWLDRLRDARATADHPLNARAVVEGLLLAYRNSMAEGRADA